MVMLILVIISLLGVAGAQISLMSERGARNDRDQLVAWQAAEAALIDAELDMIDPTSTRAALFDGKQAIQFVSGCGASGQSVGLCSLPTAGKPAWLTVNFETTGTGAATTALGTFTGKTFAAGGVGIQPSKAPRYIIELVPDPMGDASNPSFLYRVTAMGFGPREDIQALLQMVYRQ
ncbi:PilX N-terminal domain-containing pilus assembly protein [Rhodoferax sp. PAMC 29310]|uniref:pilus assembly PilX family protein n=1 Tax=Rhodoferax sp. PAMC 29310 TaxID=2822760 RepID=UPI001B32DCB9|nr:PilX N-terminal domain-containing pilus assembly protein [Rhodoferax sp. PAMC 29310]